MQPSSNCNVHLWLIVEDWTCVILFVGLCHMISCNCTVRYTLTGDIWVIFWVWFRNVNCSVACDYTLEAKLAKGVDLEQSALFSFQHWKQMLKLMDMKIFTISTPKFFLSRHINFNLPAPKGESSHQVGKTWTWELEQVGRSQFLSDTSCHGPEKLHNGKCSKISNNFPFLFSNKILVFKARFRIHKARFRMAYREDPDQTPSSEAVWSGSALFF